MHAMMQLNKHYIRMQIYAHIMSCVVYCYGDRNSICWHSALKNTSQMLAD